MRPAAVALCLMLLGCARRGLAPGDALDGFAAALERKDYDGAYGLMSPAYRSRVSATEFRKRLEANGAEISADAKMMREGARRWGDRVEVRVSEDERVTVVRAGAGWRLEDQPLDPYGQATPRAALRAFIRAVENRRYDILVRLAPARYRAILTVPKLRAYWEGENATENRALLRDLRLAVGARITEEGEEAFMTYGASRQVRFVREEGLWRVESPD